jgi:hypothetical protein
VALPRSKIVSALPAAASRSCGVVVTMMAAGNPLCWPDFPDATLSHLFAEPRGKVGANVRLWASLFGHRNFYVDVRVQNAARSEV